MNNREECFNMAEKNVLNRENIVDAMKTLLESRDDSYVSMKERMDSKGYGWDVDDCKKYVKEEEAKKSNKKFNYVNKY